MNESDRLINLLYMFLLNEEDNLVSVVEFQKQAFKHNSNDLYFLEKYVASLQKLEHFRIFRSKIIDILKNF